MPPVPMADGADHPIFVLATHVLLLRSFYNTSIWQSMKKIIGVIY
jgi:hypothetical protein